jgi:hypothetical protein
MKHVYIYIKNTPIYKNHKTSTIKPNPSNINNARKNRKKKTHIRLPPRPEPPFAGFLYTVHFIISKGGVTRTARPGFHLSHPCGAGVRGWMNLLGFGITSAPRGCFHAAALTLIAGPRISWAESLTIPPVIGKPVDFSR